MFFPPSGRVPNLCLNDPPFSCVLTRITCIDNWSPALQIRTILLSIQALLGAPNPDDPLAPDVAKAWKEDEKAAVETARQWTNQYAMPQQK